MAIGVNSDWHVDETVYQSKHPINSVTADIMYFWVKYIPGEDWPEYLLLIKRRNNPFKDMWALPGGFVNTDETILEAALREMKEETGVEVPKLSFFNYYDTPDRDPRGRTISFVYYYGASDLKKTDPPVVEAADDAVEAQWFQVKDLIGRDDIAFDHSVIISDWYNKHRRNWVH